MLKKKIWANFQIIIELFTQKIVTKLLKIWVWDPGSGKNLFRIPDPGVKKAPDPDPQHCRVARLWSNVLNFSHFICFGSCNKVQSYTPKFGHFTGLKKNRKSLGMYFFMKKMVKIYKKYLLLYRSCIALFIERGCLSKTEIDG